MLYLQEILCQTVLNTDHVISTVVRLALGRKQKMVKGESRENIFSRHFSQFGKVLTSCFYTDLSERGLNHRQFTSLLDDMDA
jgi:hypothetical protein